MDVNHLSKKERRSLRRQGLLPDDQNKSSASRARRWLVWLGALAAVGLLIWGGIALTNRPPLSNTNSVSTAETDHVRGQTTAPVTLLVYSDFQCPACRVQEELVAQLLDVYGENLAFVFRHFPLTNSHPNALAAATAAEAADHQGAFWAYHDLLFDRQDQWSGEDDPTGKFKDYATELGLDPERFAADMSSAATGELVERDIASAEALNITWTPTFYLNGRKVNSNPRDLETFKELVDGVLPR